MEPFPSKNQHVTNEDLQAFSLGKLSSEASHRVSDHLAFCPRCRLAFAEAMKSLDVPISAPIISEESSVDPTSNDLEPLLSIPGYRKLQRISQGGMGYVYVAIQEQTNKTVAIKVIQPRRHDTYGSDRKKRLIREAHALTKIDHPNIVHPLEVIMVNDAPALIMEFIRGQLLNRWIREHKPDFIIAALFTKQLTQAIVHAHQRGVVHCDLKPQNVLVTTVDSKPSLKIIDFGLAKLSDEDWSITCSGDVLGTPAYMAPEQTSGSVLKANPTIDVYGLGTILYELLTGRAPFEAPTPVMLLAKVARQTPERPSRIKSDIPISLELICLKCLEKHPDDRYASAAHLVEDLQAMLDNRPITAKPTSRYKKVTRFIQSNRAVSLTLLFSGLIAVVGMFAIGNLWREAQTKATIEESFLDTELQRQDAAKRAEQAEDAVLKELRTSFQEITEMLFGTTPEREDAEWETLDRLAKRWSRYADRVSDSKKSKLIQAEALMRIGSIHATLGDLDTAETKLSSALSTLPEAFSSADDESRRLAIESETYWQLARCLFDSGKTNESDEAFQKSRSCIDQAIELKQDDVSHGLLNARLLCDYGTMLTRIARIDDAQLRLNDSISSLEKLLTLVERGDASVADTNPRTNVLQQLLASRIAQARVFRMRGSVSQATELLVNASPQLSDLEKLDPDDPTTLRLNFLQRNALGLCQLDQGQFELSRQSFLDALYYQELLLKQYPRRQELRKNHASLLGTLAVVSIQLGKPEDALEYVSKSLGINSQLAMEYPDRQEYLGEKAKSLINLVAILASANRLQEALTYGSELIELQTKLSLEHPEQTEYAYSLAASLNIFATVLGRLGENSQAYDFFDQSQSVYFDLMDRSPTVTAYRMGFVNNRMSKAEIAFRFRDVQLAIDTYSQAIEILHSVRPMGTLAESKLLAKAYLGQASAFLGIGDHASSRVCAQLGVDTIGACKDADLQCQEIFRKCSELAKSADDDIRHLR